MLSLLGGLVETGLGAIGVRNRRVTASAVAATTICTHASFGAAAGPIGAVVGTVTGAFTELTKHTVQALLRTRKGPDNNWAYLTTRNVGERLVVFRTYREEDPFRYVRYWRVRKECNWSGIMSAGQKQNQSFRLHVCVKGKRGRVRLEKVYYRDLIWVESDPNGHLWLFHCRGELGPASSQFQVRKHSVPRSKNHGATNE